MDNRLTPQPPCHAVDRVLWNVVSNRLAYLQSILLITLCAPCALGTILPPTAGWITFYVVAVVGLASLAAVVQSSRERWLAWQAWAVGTAHRDVDVQLTRDMIASLIDRDRSRTE